jgi:hypothetical protein
MQAISRTYALLLTQMFDAVLCDALTDATTLATPRPTSADVLQAMSACITALRKTPAELRQDIHVIASARCHELTIIDAERQEREIAKLFRATRRKHARAPNLHLRLRATRSALQTQGVYAKLAEARKNADAARKEFARLRSEFPKLFVGRKR